MEYGNELKYIYQNVFERYVLPLLDTPALHIAASKGFINCAKYLIKVCDVDVNERCSLDLTALNVACASEKLHIVKLLLSQPSIDVNAKKRDNGAVPMQTALYANNVPLVRMLISHPRIDVMSIYSLACMIQAVISGVDSLNVLLTKYDKAFSKSGLLSEKLLREILDLACRNGDPETVQLLLDYINFDINKFSKTEQPFIAKACACGHRNVIKVILNHSKVLANTVPPFSRKPVSIAVIEMASLLGNVELMKLLLQNRSFKSVFSVQNMHYFAQITAIAIEHNYTQFLEIMLNLMAEIVNTEPVSVLPAGPNEPQNANRIFFSKEFFCNTTMRNLMTIALKSCTKAVPRVVDKFWNNLIEVKVEEIKKCYMVAYLPYLYANKLAGHSNELLILYHAMRLGLTDHVRKLLKILPHPIKELSKCFPGKNITIFQLSMQNRNISQIMKCLLNEDKYRVSANDAQEYRVWYLYLKKLSSSLSDAPTSTMPSEEMHRTVDWICQAITTQKSCPEFNMVCEKVDKFMQKLSKMITAGNPFLSFKPVLVGSENERTRPFMPNEFDYLLVLETLSENFEIGVYTFEQLFKVKLKAESQYNNFLESVTNKAGYLEVTKLKHILKKSFEDALLLLATVPCKDGIVVEPHCYEGGKNKRIHCMYITYRGDIYKDMKISIDLVPAFELKEYQPSMQQYFQRFGKCTYYLFTKSHVVRNAQEETGNTTILPIAFSILEGRILRSLPDEMRNGFMLAKALRRSSLFSGSIAYKLAEVVYDIEDYLPTYMLKTSTFFLALDYGLFEVGNQDFPNWSPLMWALEIYKKLLGFLKAGKVPLFFGSALPDTEMLAILSCPDLKILPESKKKSCCFRRDNLILITEHMIYVISSRLFHKGTTSLNGLICKI